jgi:cytochrome c oxidase subunit 3
MSNAVAHTHVHRDDEGAKTAMWLFLYTELLLFGALFVVYAAYRYMYPEEFHRAAVELNTIFGTVNTLILLTSSLTMAMSITALQNKNPRLSQLLLGTTLLFAVVFMVNKYFEWGAKIHHGIYPGSETLTALPDGEIIFFGLYYFMTGLHGLHIIIGIIAIAWVMVLIALQKVNDDYHSILENVGLYWHIVDIIWIFLFPLFYLIK